MIGKMDFSDVLASTLHDTKNSLGLLFSNLEDIIADCRERKCPSHTDFYKLQYEIKRSNLCLIRLLSIYKAEKSQLAINVDYHSIRDILEDMLTQHEFLLNTRGIKIETDCDPALFWVLDRNLIAGVLDNVINNSFRYAREKVVVSAFMENGYLGIRIEDDGAGYPAAMIFNEKNNPEFKKEVDFQTGSTGLGIYFSTMVAGMHKKNEKSGFISIANGGKSGGGVFSIYLP
ncbi:MAG: Virulence sensor histidine kinase PhoQ [Smithella sp. PtaU1.Bin162]|jgi:two-component system sensor histidine kinase SenX3|nr:MAG: Virulence sensor histidine kinase PhoQ [Smithella sp. PtaU1.Bin162]